MLKHPDVAPWRRALPQTLPTGATTAMRCECMYIGRTLALSDRRKPDPLKMSSSSGIAATYDFGVFLPTNLANPGGSWAASLVNACGNEVTVAIQCTAGHAAPATCGHDAPVRYMLVLGGRTFADFVHA